MQVLTPAWVRQILERVTYMLSDPLALVFGLADYAICTPGDPVVHGWCAILKGTTRIAQIIVDLKSLVDSESWKVQGDMCEVYFDRLEKMDKAGEEPAAPAAGGI